jgi:RNA polymerase sigma factor (sigma-70 family)
MVEVMTDDMTLLRAYARHNSEEAFATLVSRHVNLVYSVALRDVRDAHLAEEITQVVFIILARKADSLGAKVILSGWLCRTARYASANALTIQRRRQQREQEAYMQSTLNESEPEAWAQIAPLLGGAMAQLGQKDHDAVVLRFFEGKSFQEIGTASGASENAAKKRVAYALEKLREYFFKRGVMLPGAVITAAISANSIQAAPVVLAKTATAIALAKGATVPGSTLTLIKGVLKLMAWTKAKTAGVVVAATLLVGGGGYVTTETIHAVRAAYYPNLQGTWEGDALLEDPGVAKGEAAKTHVVLKLVKRNGVYTATTDWIELGRKDVPMHKVVYEYPSLEIERNARPDIWEFKIKPGANQMVWDHVIHFIQHDEVLFRRTAAPDLVPDPLTEEDFAPRPGSGLQGYWKGQIGTGPDAVPVDLKIAGQADGTFRAEAGNPGADGQPMTVTYNQPEVEFTRATGAGMFQGQVNGAGTEISGFWIQDGQSTAAIVKRADYRAEHAHDAEKDYSFTSKNDLQGHWRGAWDASFDGGKIKVPIHMALDIAKLPDGSYSATMASVDQFGHDAPIPASDFQFSPPNLQAEWKSAGGAFDSANNAIPSYEGKLENGKLVGTWSQSGGGFKLVFERRP